MTDQIVIEPLGEHSRAAFCCDLPRIDNFFKNNAKKVHKAYGTRVFIARREENLDPIGFYGLTVMTFDIKEKPVKMNDKAENKFSRHGQIPTIYLTMLARDKERGPKGLGVLLLQDAFERALRIREDVGVYAMTLHAVNERVKSVYEDLGFEAFEKYEPTEDGSIPMFITLDQAAASFS